MLCQTFTHLTGIGEHTERRIWQAGVRTWEDFLGADHVRLPGKARKPAVVAGVRESIEMYRAGRWSFFEKRLPPSTKWRAFGDFPDRVLYVDIETDGGQEEDSITLIGAYDGNRYRSFVAGVNLDEARDEMERYPLVVTFNGARFDIPMIGRRFRYSLFNFVHIDLYYPLKKLGYRGGLKSIERRLGLERSPETQGLDGWDAVKLWQRFQAGDADALRLLEKYNSEDTKNLAPLMELVYSELSQASPERSVTRHAALS